MRRPICTACETEFRPSKNGVTVVQYSGNGPYTLAEADEWTCPNCGHRIIVGFGETYARHPSPEQLARIPVELWRSDFENQEQRKRASENHDVVNTAIKEAREAKL